MSLVGRRKVGLQVRMHRVDYVRQLEMLKKEVVRLKMVVEEPVGQRRRLGRVMRK